MQRPATLLFIVASVLMVVPGWTGETRLPLLGRTAQVEATPVALDPADPQRRRVGRLLYLGGVALRSRDPAFGGFSSLAVRHGRVTLVSDGGNLVGFGLSREGRVLDPAFGALAGGPGSGWEKRDRDAESMVLGADGRMWIGFESRTAIFRYGPGGAVERAVRPPAMTRWPDNAGPESMARAPDGRFVVIAEGRQRARAGAPRQPRGERTGLIFLGDPTARGAVPVRFTYRPPAGFDPSDAAFLPDGRLLILNRRFRLPFRFVTQLVEVPAGAIRAGAVVTGTPVALLDTPLIHDNFEGIAVTGDARRPVIWLVSDNNESWPQRTLLLRFRLIDTPKPRRR